MQCEHVAGELKALADHELSLFRALRVRLHAALCGACKRELADIRGVCGEVAALPQPSTPEAARSRIRHAAAASSADVGAERPSADDYSKALQDPEVLQDRRAAPLPSTARARRRYLPRIAGVAVPAAVCAALVAFFLYRQSPATALDQIRAAAGNVRSMHMVSWETGEGGKPIHDTTWYADGKWRFEEKNGVIRIYDGRRSHRYDPQRKVFFKNRSKQPFGMGFSGFTIEAMLKTERGSRVSLDRNTTWEGRRALRVQIDEPESGGRMIVWADPHTDLPIAFRGYVRTPSGWEPRIGSELIEYNRPVPKDLFNLKVAADATIIDMETFEQDWRARYERGIARQTVGKVTVILRDFQVCLEGDVFVIYTPEQHHDAWLSDDLGTEYVKMSTTFQPWNDGGLWFMPVNPLSRRPTRYVLRIELEQPVTWARRTVAFTVTKPFYSPLACPLYPQFAFQPGHVAFIYPGPDEVFVQSRSARAGYWRARGDMQAAADQYEALMVHAGRLQPHTWQSIGQLYEELGDADKAREAYKRGLESIRSGPGYQGYDEWFRESLRRLEGKSK